MTSPSSDLFEISPIAILKEDWSHVKKAVDQAILDHGEDFESFLGRNPGFVYEVRHVHRILDANRAALDLIGFAAKEEFLEVSSRMLPADPNSNIQVLKAIARKDTLCQGERLLRTRDGRVVPILWRARLPDGDEGFDALHFFAVDTTEIKRLQSELMSAQADLNHAARLSLTGELAASLAHEVSQPLASIIGHSAAARRWMDRAPPDLGEVSSSLERITASTRHAIEIVGKMRAFTRRTESRFNALNMRDCAVDAVALIAHEALREKTVVRVDLPDTVPAVMGDRTQIQQVIVNIVLNAIQAMQSEACKERLVTIGLSEGEAGHVTIAISDTGPGIAAGDLSRLFQPFFTTKEEGMGLGLSICKRIIENHGGRLRAANRVRGAEIFFSLPVPDGDLSCQP